jgi:TRAP-type C4-dicarboxylate transport system substrate-binding protein
MKLIKRIILSLIVLVMISTFVYALKIKLGSLVPTGSAWDISLRKIAAEWNKASNGKIILKIYPGGIAGNEGDMLKKIMIGQLDAAGITGVGMSDIFQGILAIQLPMIIRDEKELDYVLDKMKPYYEEKCKENGYKVLFWNRAGWAYFFSRNPVKHPDDLKKQKLFVWEGDADLIQTWKEFGYKPVPLASSEVMTSLQTGMVDALMTSPLSAAAMQWFGKAKNMCDMKVSPFIGGVVISIRTWKKIPEDIRPELEKIAKEIGAEMQANVLNDDKEAMKIMKEYGLKINHADKKDVMAWEELVNNSIEKLKGKTVHEESLRMVRKYVEEYREKYGRK